MGFASKPRRTLWRKLAVLAAVCALPVVAHLGIGVGTRISPPAIQRLAGEPASEEGIVRLGRAYARHRGRVLEVRLEGSPEQIGHQHGRLLYDQMVENEGRLLADFRRFVP